MKRITLLLLVLIAGGAAAWTQTTAGTDFEPMPRSAKEVRGATSYSPIRNEPPPKLIVDPPLHAVRQPVRVSGEMIAAT